MSVKSKLGSLSVVLAASAVGCVAVTDGSSSETLGETSEALSCDLTNVSFYLPPPNPGANDQIDALNATHHRKDAKLIKELIQVPHAVWINGGTSQDTKKAVRKVVLKAQAQEALPVLVAYNIPFRDCAQFSAGGATTKAEYEAWIDAFVAGIGGSDAIVILEPDSLGIIPWYNPFADRDTWLDDPNVLEWCQPSEADPATAAADRFEMLTYAVNAFKTNPGTLVYMDGTHTAWLGSGDVADRLAQAGVANADGFFLNASNYQEDARLEKYGAWIAKCLWFADPASGSWGAGHSEWCGSQYSPASPDDFSTWALTDQWYADNVESQTWVPYPGNDGLKHFVTDTSRNGVGPWYATPEQSALGDVQDWCNPPDRGVGQPPTGFAGDELLQARLWIKVPGESDGQCNRWEPSGSPDPVRGMMDPAAGVWFPEQALELAKNANPSL